MNAKYKKSLRIVTLLITSVIIATVAADTYSELFMYGNNISIGTASVIFTAGSNTTTLGGSDAINAPGTQVTFDTIPAIEPGETRTYEQAVNITNNAGATKSITLSYVSLTGQFEANFDYLNITMINTSGASKGSNIEIVSSGTNSTTSGSQDMSVGEVWAVRWIIKAKTGATGGSISLTLKVTVD